MKARAKTRAPHLKNETVAVQQPKTKTAIVNSKALTKSFNLKSEPEKLTKTNILNDAKYKLFTDY